MTNLQASKPIAIFDSGVGGLTVAKALKKNLPHESFLYLADTASRPFGIKTKQELEEILKKNTKTLLEFPLKIAIIACHSACSCGLASFAELNVPIMGIATSSFEMISQVPSTSTLVVLGTHRTISSGLYQNYVNSLPRATSSYFLPCSPIEQYIESFCLDPLLIQKEINSLLSHISKLKNATILLACTHFPIYKDYIQKALHPSCIILDPAEHFAEKIQKTLSTLSLLTSHLEPTDQYLITQDPETFKKKFFYYFNDSLAKTKPFFNHSYAII